MNEMKPSALIRVSMASLLALGIITYIVYYNKTTLNEESIYTNQLYEPSTYNEIFVDGEITETKEPEKVVVYDNMTMEELTDKLNNILSSNLSGMGQYYAKYSIELGVDPYLAVAISMHETGCTWNCSYLARECNNVGGQKGSGCGSYKRYDTLEEGIYGFISNIKRNYVDYGLLTADQMNPKYAEDPMWSSKVNKYIEKIKNS